MNNGLLVVSVEFEGVLVNYIKQVTSHILLSENDHGLVMSAIKITNSMVSRFNIC